MKEDYEARIKTISSHLADEQAKCEAHRLKEEKEKESALEIATAAVAAIEVAETAQPQILKLQQELEGAAKEATSELHEVRKLKGEYEANKHEESRHKEKLNEKTQDHLEQAILSQKYENKMLDLRNELDANIKSDKMTQKLRLEEARSESERNVANLEEEFEKEREKLMSKKPKKFRSKQ